ncbi:MAG: hypothetical protein K6T72_09860 [Anoxybacillus sp.]|nr:hypothetical protein [Anoxybacillus sp.]MCL6586799.1 hypothetical protein [Anoxybacillus sp.]
MFKKMSFIEKSKGCLDISLRAHPLDGGQENEKQILLDSAAYLFNHSLLSTQKPA